MPDDDADCLWTDAQKAAFNQIEAIIREHFDAGVYVCLAEINDKQDEARANYSGGKHAAIGLHSTALHSLVNKVPDEPLP